MGDYKFVSVNGFDGTVIPNPYDPEYTATDSLGVENVPPGIIGRRTVASLLPGETTKHYNTIDCHKRALKCTVGHNDTICSACRTVGGGDCIKASNDLKLARGWDLDDETIGVCAPNVQHLDIANPFTTVEEAYLLKLDNGEVVMTRRKGCIDKNIVNKSPQVLNDPYTDEGAFGCTEVTMCGSGGVPLHPKTREPIHSADDINFDIVELAGSMECNCDRGFKMERDTVTGIPSCRPLSAGIEGPEEMGCPVKFTTDGISWNCLSDPSLQTRVRDVVDTDPIVTAGGSDYLKEYMFSVRKLDEIMQKTDQTDACIPQVGVDPRMAAMGYSYAAHLFGTAPELTAFNGGHLATGGLLRRSAMTEQGKWHSRIEGVEPGKIVMSESLGGVVPYIGTGAIAAHVWNGDALNKNKMVGPCGSGDEHPNASMRVVPLPRSNIPGLGIDSVDHAVAFLASQGRVYPGGVYERIQKTESLAAANPRGSDINIESSYLQEPNREDLLNTSPLAYDRKTHDSGVCAMSFLVPSIEGSVITEESTSSLILPLMHYRPCARRMCHTPVERMFEKFVLSPVSHSGFSVGLEVTADHPVGPAPLAEHLIKKFSRMYGEELSKASLETAEAKARIITDRLKSKGLGALSLQPVTCTPDKYSSMFSGFPENILSENSPKIIDHYKVSSNAYGYLIDEDASLIGGGFRRSAAFPKPPTCWRIVCNESCFFSGRGLNSGVEGTGMQENESENYDHPVDFYASAVLSADSVLMNGSSSKLLRPLNVPACSIPETLWHERRNPVRGDRSDPGRQTVLEQVRNAFKYLTGREFSVKLNADDNSKAATNTYAPPKPYSLTKITEETRDLGAVFGIAMAFNPTLVGLQGASNMHDVLIREGPRETYSSVGGYVPSKFHYGDELWQQGEFLAESQRANVVPTPMPLFEAQLRMRTLSSENFLDQKASRVDWADTTHTAGHYLFGVHSPPSTREETGQAMAYPSTGALAQYTTLLVPKTLGPSSHSKHTRRTLRDKIQEMAKTGDIFDVIAQEAVKEACNCTCDVYCPLTNRGADGKTGGRSTDDPIAGQPSRGNRHSQFLLASTLPKNDIHLSYALLMMQNGDKGILDALGSPYNKGEDVDIESIVKRGWDLSTISGIASSKFDAFRRNTSFSVPRATRRPKHLAGKFTDSTWDGIEFDRKTTEMMDLLRDGGTAPDDPSMQPVPADDNDILTLSQRMRLDNETGARARRQIDFLENATGTAPSTFSVGMFAPHVEGSRDIVAMYGTPLFSHRASKWNAKVNERTTGNSFSGERIVAARSKRKTENFSFAGTLGPSVGIFFKSELPKIMRRVFIQPINAPNAEGFACGLTASEAICTRGKEIWYKPTTKPAMSPRATTSMEGIRSKAAEPFDTLSVKGFKRLSSHEIQKFTHHHHYGYDGLMTVAYRDRERLYPLPKGRRVFPFTCQTDRRPFPQKWDGSIQPLALAEMGAAPRIRTTLEF